MTTYGKAIWITTPTRQKLSVIVVEIEAGIWVVSTDSHGNRVPAQYYANEYPEGLERLSNLGWNVEGYEVETEYGFTRKYIRVLFDEEA